MDAIKSEVYYEKTDLKTQLKLQSRYVDIDIELILHDAVIESLKDTIDTDLYGFKINMKKAIKEMVINYL